MTMTFNDRRKVYACRKEGCPNVYRHPAGRSTHERRYHGFAISKRRIAVPVPTTRENNARINALKERFVRGGNFDSAGILELMALSRKKAS